MKTVKVSSLTNAALDWAVAKCEGFPLSDYCPHDKHYRDCDDKWFCPSTDWSQGGPIIEREFIGLQRWNEEHEWAADIGGDFEQYGPTPLIAAMRCYVASKLGDSVEIPEKLTQ